MIKNVKHSGGSLASLKSLWGRVKYIVDARDKNHIDKLVLPARNHGCTGDGPESFVGECENRFQRYQSARKGKCGKRTKKIWKEYVYSSEYGKCQDATGKVLPCLNEEERAEIERALLAGPIGRGVARLAWHIDLCTGRCDLHVLVCIYDCTGKNWENDGYGKGAKNLHLELERSEEALLVKFNAYRSPSEKLKTPRQRHNEKRRAAKQRTFSGKLVASGWDGKPEALVEAAEAAGYSVSSLSEKSIVVRNQYTKKNKDKRYNIKTLTQNWVKAKNKTDPSDIE